MPVTDASAERPTRLNPQTRVGGINFSVVPSIGPSTASTPETRWGISGCRTDLASDPHNAFNQLTSSTRSGGGLPSLVTAYVYDNNGNLTSETAGSAATTYTWDADNRLRQVTQLSLLSSYEYDANGLRTKKVEVGVETRFLLDGQSVLAELDSANAATRRYLHNPEAIDDILEFTEGGATYFPLTDALGSVVAITDSVGAVVRRNTYEVYGAGTSTGTGPQWAFGFTGREHDGSGLNYNRDRFYMARTGNWLQADRAGMIDGPSRYEYARGLPTMATDPSGQGSITVNGGGWFETQIWLMLRNTFTGYELWNDIQTSDVNVTINERTGPASMHVIAETAGDGMFGCVSSSYHTARYRWLNISINTTQLAWWNGGGLLPGFRTDRQWTYSHDLGEIAAHELGHAVGIIAHGFDSFNGSRSTARGVILRGTDGRACRAGRAYRSEMMSGWAGPVRPGVGVGPSASYWNQHDETNPDECR